MANTDRRDPFRQFKFRVELGNIQVAGFSECTFADSNTDVIEYREGNERNTVRKLSGLTKYGTITLKRGITDSMDLYNWRQTVIDSGTKDLDKWGEDPRKNISIILMNLSGDTALARWEIESAWPSKYDPPDFNAKTSEVAIETFEIVHEGFTRVKPK